MISTSNNETENVNRRAYEEVLNINVYKPAAEATLPNNNVSRCVGERKQTPLCSNKIQLEYLDKPIKEPNKDGGSFKTNTEFSYIDENCNGRDGARQNVDETKVMRCTDESEGQTNKLTNYKQLNKFRASPCKFKKEVKENDEADKIKFKKVFSIQRDEMKNYDTNTQQETSDIKKSKYYIMIGDHAYLDKFDREERGSTSQYRNPVPLFGNSCHHDNYKQYSNDSSKNSENYSKIETFNTSIKHDHDFNGKINKAVNIIDMFSKPVDVKRFTDRRDVGECAVQMKGDCNSLVMNSMIGVDSGNYKKNDTKRDKTKRTPFKSDKFKGDQDSSGIRSNNVPARDKTTEDAEPLIEKSNRVKKNESEKITVNRNKGEGDVKAVDSLKSDRTNLSVKILLPVNKDLLQAPNVKDQNRLGNVTLDKPVKEEMGNTATHSGKQMLPEDYQQLYFNFPLSERNLFGKYFSNKKTDQHPRDSNSSVNSNGSKLEVISKSASASRLGVISLHNKQPPISRKSKSKLVAKRSKFGEAENKKIYPGNILKMKKNETPCQYLNQFSSILVDNLKDPVPKDPDNMPSPCNVYVPLRKRPIPLEKYEEHSIQSSVTENSTGTSVSDTSDTSDSNSQSTSSSSSTITLKKANGSTNVSGKNNNKFNNECLQVKENERERHLRNKSRQKSDHSLDFSPGCCFIL